MDLEDEHEIIACLNEVISKGTPARRELRGTGPNGEMIFDVYFEPKRDTQNEITGLSFTALNITERKKADEALRKSEEEYSSLFTNMIDGFAYCQMIFDEKSKPVDFVYLQINDAFEKITGLKRELVVGKKVTKAIPGIKAANPELFEIYGRVALTGQKEKFEIFFKPLSLWLNVSVYCPAKGYFATVFENIAERKKMEQELSNSLEESYQRGSEISALLTASRAVLQNKDFQDSARAIFDSAKELIGATAGYVALLSKDGKENEVLFLDSGGRPCTVDPSLPILFEDSAPKPTTPGKLQLKTILTKVNGRNSCLKVMCNSITYCLHH
jgi:PAS domain S-box-containing protein